MRKIYVTWNLIGSAKILNQWNFMLYKFSPFDVIFRKVYSFGKFNRIFFNIISHWLSYELARFPASIGGCSQEEIDALIESGVDVGQSSIECGNDARDPGAANSVNDPIQSDEMDQQKRGRHKKPFTGLGQLQNQRDLIRSHNARLCIQ